MFFRMMKGTFTRQWKKMLMIAITIALGASIATAMLNVMMDVGDKINEELKTYGANISVVSKTAAVIGDLYDMDTDERNEKLYLKENVLGELLTIFWANNIRDFAPFNDGKAKLGDTDVKIVGTWFNYHLSYVKKGTEYTRDTGLVNLRSWWDIKSGRWIDQQTEENDNVCMVGANVAKAQNISVGDNITLLSTGSTETLKVVGIFESGDDEDDQIFLPLSTCQKLTETEGYVRRISVSAITSPDDELSERAAKDPSLLSMADYDLWYCTAYVSSICYQIQEAIDTASASAVRQIADSEGGILEKTKLLMTLITVLSLLGAAIGISNLVTSSVMERSQELGLMKAIGAKNGQITVLVLTEIGIVAIIGAVVGYFMGFGFAQIIGHTVFGSAIQMNGIVAFLVALLIIAVTIIGSIPAMRMILRLRPSEVLHGR
ncbi:MAG: ABC transporter permease [Clostridia bacterium]|nr:ABC transporter permease [Clostridia bacterium]